jgi:hypothetical protein
LLQVYAGFKLLAHSVTAKKERKENKVTKLREKSKIHKSLASPAALIHRPLKPAYHSTLSRSLARSLSS